MTRRLLFAALCLAPLAVDAQTVRKTRTRNVVEDSVCAPGTGWETRAGRYTSASAASIAARTKLTCAPPVVTPPVVVPPVVAPPIVTPPVVTEWIAACGGFNSCLFDGIRDVRIVQTNGTSTIVKRVMGFPGIPCTGARCDIGPLYTRKIANPRPGHIWGDSVVVPVTDTGYAVPLSTLSDFVGRDNGSGLGDFRTTCNPSHFAFNDPMVYPRQPGMAHLHIFFGNPFIDAFTTAEDMEKRPRSTCRGGTLNSSGYWVPVVYDSVTKQIMLPRFGQFYYKSPLNSDQSTIEAPPVGLRMIAGDANNVNEAAQNQIFWACGGPNQTSQIPDCVNGVTVMTFAVTFPSCWDGKNLDSPDHKSHMAYPIYRNPPQKSYCPATHPRQIPQISQQLDYPVYPGARPDRWRLSSDMYSTTIRGGRSSHADWMLGWHMQTMLDLVVRCLRKGLDCGVGNTGGTVLTYP